MQYQFNPLDFPQGPGVYLMKDEQNRFVYVGKAKDLRSRLSSYFRSIQTQTPKTRVLLTRVSKIEYITTLSEKEALLLESSLIKKHRPRYNIVLRDDKQYVLFRLNKALPYPALELTRSAKKDKSLYFGPFTSALAARQTLKVINRLFMLRKCGHKKFRNRVRPCLQYFIKRCPGPCCLEVSPEEYGLEVRRLEMFLSGRSGELLRRLEKDMHQAALELNFEKAALIRDQVSAVRQTTQAQSVVFPGMGDMDVFVPVQVHGGLGIGILFVRQGKVLDSRNFFWPEQDFEESSIELSGVAAGLLSQFYGPDKYIPEKIVLPQKVHDPALVQLLSEYRRGKVRLIGARGESMKGLLHIARNNCLEHVREKMQTCTLSLARVFRLEQEPERIECIDVSHLFGQSTRVGVVVFVDGEPRKQDYRTYKLPGVPPGDDYQAMREFMYRRSSSSMPWPDLLLIDGGRGQLGCVCRVLQELSLEGSFALAAIAKAGTRSGSGADDQLFIPGRGNPLPVRRNSPELLFLQKIRDEAHRFALHSMHKNRRKSSVSSGLENIPGLGPKRVRALWDYFGDLHKIINATEDQLKQVPGFGPERARKTELALKKWNTINS